MCHHRPLDKGHDDFIFRNEDFVTPIKKSQQCNGINDFIEAFISRWPQCPLKVSALQNDRMWTGSLPPCQGECFNSSSQALLGFKKQNADREKEETYLFSSRRIALVANIVVVCIAISILLIPVFVLYMANITRVQSSGVVLVFTVLFAAMISLIADTKVENVFMSTCG
jgi:hypothetical protein